MNDSNWMTGPHVVVGDACVSVNMYEKDGETDVTILVSPARGGTRDDSQTFFRFRAHVAARDGRVYVWLRDMSLFKPDGVELFSPGISGGEAFRRAMRKAAFSVVGDGE